MLSWNKHKEPQSSYSFMTISTCIDRNSQIALNIRVISSYENCLTKCKYSCGLLTPSFIILVYSSNSTPKNKISLHKMSLDVCKLINTSRMFVLSLIINSISKLYQIIKTTLQKFL